MPPSIVHHASSYRDPSGFLFLKDGKLYRQVSQSFKKDFDLFISSGLYQHLIERRILIPHQTIGENFTESEQWYKTLQPEYLNFISYPYEWCLDMLKDAALLTLEVAKDAINFGMMLKDASAYNVQWHNGKMIFIDTLSFEEYHEQKPWIAYRQFCEHFFAPLALMHYLKEPLQNLMMAYPDGISLAVAKKLLPLKSKFNLNSYLHLHFHAAMSNKSKSDNAQAKPFSRQKLKNLIRSLEDGIKLFSLSDRSGVWSGYYEEAYHRENYVAAKKEIVLKWMSQLTVSSVLDAGANEGAFSELLHDKVSHIVSADLDHYSINQFYNRIKKKEIKNIVPLIIDFSNPSPFLGVNNTERASFEERTKTDLVLALAFIHHLTIGKNIPFENLVEMFYSPGRYLMIEFIPKEDEKIQQMLKQKKDIYSWYTEEAFIKSFEKKFSILHKEAVGNSGRTLYLMQTHEN